MVDSGGKKRANRKPLNRVSERQILQGDRIIRRFDASCALPRTCGRWTRACTRVHQRGQCKTLRQKSEKESLRVTGRHRHEEEGKKKPFMYSLYINCSWRRETSLTCYDRLFCRTCRRLKVTVATSFSNYCVISTHLLGTK